MNKLYDDVIIMRKILYVKDYNVIAYIICRQQGFMLQILV